MLILLVLLGVVASVCKCEPFYVAVWLAWQPASGVGQEPGAGVKVIHELVSFVT